MHIFAAIGHGLLTLVLPALASTIAALGVALLNKQLQRLGLSLTAEQEARIKEIIVTGILAAEEASRTDTALKGGAKEDYAVAQVAPKLPTLTEPDIRQRIQAALPEVRAKLTPSTPGTLGR